MGPDVRHEQFLGSLRQRIHEQLRLLSNCPGPAADFARDAFDTASATIIPADPERGTHNPDGSFKHLTSPRPTVILEVAGSQRGKILSTLVEDYILGSDLKTRVVIGVDFEHEKHQRATCSV